MVGEVVSGPLVLADLVKGMARALASDLWQGQFAPGQSAEDYEALLRGLMVAAPEYVPEGERHVRKPPDPEKLEAFRREELRNAGHWLRLLLEHGLPRDTDYKTAVAAVVEQAPEQARIKKELREKGYDVD